MRAVNPPRWRARSRRRGVVTLEIILVLPIFLIVLMAIVEFGLLFSNEQMVESASRAGTQVASRLLVFPASGAVPAEVETAVSRELAKIGVTNYRIRMEHNIDLAAPLLTMAPVVLTTTTAGGPTSVPSPPAIALSPNRPYVRVTVYVWTTHLTPNLLDMYGVDLSNRVSNQTKIRGYAR